MAIEFSTPPAQLPEGQSFKEFMDTYLAMQGSPGLGLPPQRTQFVPGGSPLERVEMPRYGPPPSPPSSVYPLSSLLGVKRYPSG
mgnify:FL=1